MFSLAKLIDFRDKEVKYSLLITGATLAILIPFTSAQASSFTACKLTQKN